MTKIFLFFLGFVCAAQVAPAIAWEAAPIWQVRRGVSVALQASDQRFVMMAVGSKPLPEETELLLGQTARLVDIRRHLGVYSFDDPIAAAELVAAIGKLSREKSDFWLAPYYTRREAPSEIYLPTNRVCFGLKVGHDAVLPSIEASFPEFSIEPVGRTGTSYIATVDQPTSDTLHISNLLLEAFPDAIDWAHPDFVTSRTVRRTLNDPLIANQWHLAATNQLQVIPGNDLNVTAAWDVTLGSIDVPIAVIDSGLDFTHEDIAPNYLGGFDVLDGDFDPTPGFDVHGTSVAGVAAAVGDNGIGVAGVAPNAGLYAIRLVEGGFSFVDEANAFAATFDLNVAVAVNSWGPNDRTGMLQPLPPLVESEIRNLVRNGWGGRGTAIIWAAGNGHPIDSVDLDGYASSDLVMAVGSLGSNGVKAGESEEGQSLDIMSPSSGGGAQIWTTSFFDQYTGFFGGTSAAAPGIGGVAALVRAANPDLNATQTYRVITDTARKVNPSDAQYGIDGHSTKYGFGLADAAAAVHRAVALGDGVLPTLTPTPTPTIPVAATPTPTPRPTPAATPTLAPGRLLFAGYLATDQQQSGPLKISLFAFSENLASPLGLRTSTLDSFSPLPGDIAPDGSWQFVMSGGSAQTLPAGELLLELGDPASAQSYWPYLVVSP